VHRCEFERPAHALTGVAPYDSGRSPLRSAGRRRYKIPLERKRRTVACPLLLCGFLLARYYVNPSADVRLPAFLRVVISIVARRLRSVAYTRAVHVVLTVYIWLRRTKEWIFFIRIRLGPSRRRADGKARRAENERPEVGASLIISGRRGHVGGLVAHCVVVI